MTPVTPSVDTTIFPRINLYKNFTARAVRRDVNGRIFGQYGDLPIDDPSRYPAVQGSLEFDEIHPFDLHDLGSDVSTTPTRVLDLRNPETDYLSNPDPFVHRYNLGPLHPNVDDTYWYPAANGAVEYATLLPYPIDLGSDVTVAPSGTVDLRLSNSTYSLNPLEDLAPPADGSIAFSNALPFPVELGPDVATATTDIFDLTLGTSTYNLN